MERFQPVNSPKITDLIIEQIRETILSGEIKPSEKLPPERELVTRFKASRVAVREALKNLEASGLLIIKPGSGVFVAETDSKTMSDSLYSILRMENTSLNEVTEARLIFEPHVARLAAERISGDDILLLEANIKKTEAVLKANKPTTAENVEFHSLVAGSVHNTVIALTMKTLLDVARVMTIEIHDNIQERFAISFRSFEQHKHIVKAFRQKDAEKAYQMMFDHIIEIQEALKKAIPGK
jgi:GntR family transcriptional regulator, transcriptional repressor for pyruvate dehydrogenase complex